MKKMDKNFEKILFDKTAGSAELFEKLLIYFSKKVKGGESIRTEIDLAKKYLSHFAVINNNILSIEHKTQSNEKESILKYLSKILEVDRNTYKIIFNSIPNKIKSYSNIVTLSNSKTVYEVLKFWHQYNSKIEVTICESQPECEGKILSKKLLKVGIKTKVVLDSETSNILEKADLLLLSCDVILNNGDIVNKIGSRTAAIIAKNFKKPVIVISSKDKQIKSNRFRIKGRGAIEKSLFERVEKELIHRIVTD